MIFIIISIIGLLVIVALFTFFQKTKKETKNETEIDSPSTECCGAHAVCEKELKKVAPQIDYYDDEELDQFQGISSDAYTDDQIDQFREILYTLPPGETEDWLISLEKRGIEIPDILKQELN